MCRLFISKWKRAVKENKQACFRETLSLYHRSQGSQGTACTFLIGLGQRRAAGEEPGSRVGELQNSDPLKKNKHSPFCLVRATSEQFARVGHLETWLPNAQCDLCAQSSKEAALGPLV